jgi:vacuolar-type H+-ATPase subunit I/STV1
VWAVTVHVTNWNIGYLAFFIGYAVGKVVHWASGKRRGATLQWLAAFLAGIGVAAGKIGIVVWAIVDALHANGEEVTPQRVLQLIQDHARSVASPFDLVWIGFAAYAAWRMCRAVNVTMAGPFAYEPAASPLQFHTVEPLKEIPPATPPGNP